ncbi:hypothetical protein M404DRAFT_1004588 [Pisolithus tinctorius Marx 270]|uniref:Uncharacterized protein n=1 Tax=Pisolithus tinctorius Marx 270 TaxID=870435 RepID=A0A0C3NEZ6_PISTI|nr:hypothetical protein M404DRAFT_1004588 [Pisolithus tinctorius Marx 270]
MQCTSPATPRRRLLRITKVWSKPCTPHMPCTTSTVTRSTLIKRAAATDLLEQAPWCIRENQDLKLAPWELSLAPSAVDGYACHQRQGWR